MRTAATIFMWLLLVTCSGAVGNDAMNKPTLTILFTGDRHGHLESWLQWEGPSAGKQVGGMDRLASVVKAVRHEIGPSNVLLLDSGDAIGDTFIAAQTKGKAVIELMNAVGYDAMTIGNHEPDFGVDELRARMTEAQFPFLAANLFDESGKPFTKEFIIREVGGVKIGILGLAYANTPLTTASRNVEGLDFKSPSEAAKAVVPRVRAAGAQIVLALAHGGLGAEKQIAEAVPEIDIIVGGHSHNRTDEALLSGRTIVVQAGAHGEDLGRLDIWMDHGRITKHQVRLIVLDHETIGSDLETAERLRTVVAPFEQKQNEVIARALAPIVRAQTMAGNEPRHRSHESAADSLFADILREHTKSEIALLPGVGYGVAIPAGDVTVGLLRNLIPHESRVVTLTLSGREVRQVLEQAVHNTFTDDPSEKVGGMIQVSGLTFVYDQHAGRGERVKEVEAAGQAIEPSRRYKVVTNSMLAEGGHNYETFTNGQNKEEHEGQFELIRRWMKAQGQVRTPAPGRIRSVGDGG